MFIGCCLHGVSYAAVLTKDTLWEGEIKVSEDILVPKGITLTIKRGTIITVVSAESTKTDPEYMSPLTEITVRGVINIEGTEKTPVFFSSEENRAGSWAGIVVDHGIADIAFARIRNAETAVHVINGHLKMHNGILRDNRYGLVAQGSIADASLTDSLVTSNDYGVFILNNARITTKSSTTKGNRNKDEFSAPATNYEPDFKLDPPADSPVGRRYKDEVFRGDVVWQGHIEVAGVIRVPQGSRLIVLPGTVVEFTKIDKDGDGIGENGILIQGRLIAKGTKELPIVFRSANRDSDMGGWDSINIMDSSGPQNIVEYCRIENAYRGLHFHFSSVAVHKSLLINNYRGIQFQESLVDLTGNVFLNNKSGIQGRDSDLTFANNVVYNNYVGANFFRVTLSARGNIIVGNWKEGWRIREGASTLQENLIDGNRQGLLLADMYYGSYSRNVISNNLENGLSLKNSDNIEISENFIVGNRGNGVNIQDSRAVIKGNQITDNLDRGIGVQTFGGVITENNIADNGLFAIDLSGINDVEAPSNWWGGKDPSLVIYDKLDDVSRGTVRCEKPGERPIPSVWPLKSISTNMQWRGTIVVKQNTSLMTGAELKIAPKTTVRFSQGTGLLVKGRIVAVGTSDGKISFTSLEKNEASSWDEIRLEYATGSIISHCLFEYATWGLHSHFTNLSISDSQFINNYGGVRFRSGPLEVKHTVFHNNSIGIRAYLGNGVIKENVISNNETGIFVREKGGGLMITGNNMFENSNYNIRIGDFNNEDVKAPDNWWGGDPLQTIFDGRNEPGIGNVIYEPFRNEPFKLNMENL